MRGCILLLWLVPAIAVAQEAPSGPSQNAEANQHFATGMVAYEQKHDYDTSSREFEAAYKIDPLPALLWSWAQSERLANRCSKALELYKKYLYTDISASQTDTTRKNIKLCEKQLQAQPETKPPPDTQPITDNRPRWYEDKLGGALSISGVVGIGLGVTFLALASSRKTEADAQMFLDDYKTGIDAATTRRRAGAVFLVLGAGALAGGITVYVMHSKERKQQPITAGTDGRSIFVGTRF